MPTVLGAAAVLRGRGEGAVDDPRVLPGEQGAGRSGGVTATRARAQDDEATEVARPSRREVLRDRTAAEIRDAAREHLRTAPASELSLRAVARDLGMTAPALYRYYDGRDALLEALSVDAYDALTSRLKAAADAEPQEKPVQALLAASLAYRRWALDAPHEFALVFGTPVPGFDPGEGSPVGDAGARFGDVFLALLRAAVGDGSGIRHLPEAALPPQLLQRFRGLAELCWEEPTDAWLVQLWLSCWVRLHGAVSLEVFGHLRFAIDPWAPTDDTDGLGEQLYRALLAELADRYGIGDAALSFALPERDVPTGRG